MTEPEMTGNAYVDSIICSYKLDLSGPTTVVVPDDAQYMAVDGHSITFYRSHSRDVLIPVPEELRGHEIRIPRQ